jgi:3-deoxy-D-manno-octulosonic-acid transferase
VYAQDAAGAEVARRLGAPHAAVAGDPRFDRVVAIADAAVGPVPHIAEWVAGRPCLVAGSVWPADVALIGQALAQLQALTGQRPVVIWAPHVTGPAEAAALARRHGGLSYAQLLAAPEAGAAHTDLWIDRVGLLARLYAHGGLAYVGGGLGAGVHNTLEAAVWGRRVLFGPKHARFREAVGLVAAGGARAVHTAEELAHELKQLMAGAPEVAAAGARAAAYVRAHTGATARIVAELLPLLDATAPTATAAR